MSSYHSKTIPHVGCCMMLTHVDAEFPRAGYEMGILRLRGGRKALAYKQERDDANDDQAGSMLDQRTILRHEDIIGAQCGAAWTGRDAQERPIDEDKLATCNQRAGRMETDKSVHEIISPRSEKHREEDGHDLDKRGKKAQGGTDSIELDIYDSAGDNQTQVTYKRVRKARKRGTMNESFGLQMSGLEDFRNFVELLGLRQYTSDEVVDEVFMVGADESGRMNFTACAAQVFSFRSCNAFESVCLFVCHSVCLSLSVCPSASVCVCACLYAGSQGRSMRMRIMTQCFRDTWVWTISSPSLIYAYMNVFRSDRLHCDLV